MTAPAKKEVHKTNGVLVASSKDVSGKGVARALRREGKIPGTLYGKGQTPVSISLFLKEVTQEYVKGRFRSRLVEIKIDGKESVKALPKDLQFNPVTDVIEHVDFIKVEKGTQLRVSVPVKIVGQEKAVGLKRGGVLNVVRHEIDFLCAPDSIPTSLEVNVQKLDIGGSFHIQDMDLPKGITPVIKRNFTIATIAGRSKEEEAAPVVSAPVAAATPAKKEEKKGDKR